jgi:transaldolase/glucose-6-phosphate isomerase
VLYVDNLIGPNTVKTIPPETLEEFLDHGKVALTIERDLDEAHSQLARLEELGINLNEVTHDLLDEGVKKFEQSFDKLTETISKKQATLVTA